MSIRDKVKVGLIQKGWTQKKLAQEMGIHYHYLQQILVGERRPPERIKEIENFLNIDLKEEK